MQLYIERGKGGGENIQENKICLQDFRNKFDFSHQSLYLIKSLRTSGHIQIDHESGNSSLTVVY
jgi:hypothetical protein